MSVLRTRIYGLTLPWSQLRHSSSGYKSDVSLDKLYPGRETVKVSPPDLSSVKFTGHIPMSSLTTTSTDTAVDIRFHVNSAGWISQEIKEKINSNLGSELTREGWLVVKSDRTNSRTLNMADALEKLRANIRMAENSSPAEETFDLLEVEKERKAKLKAARERLHIKL